MVKTAAPGLKEENKESEKLFWKNLIETINSNSFKGEERATLINLVHSETQTFQKKFSGKNLPFLKKLNKDFPDLQKTDFAGKVVDYVLEDSKKRAPGQIAAYQNQARRQGAKWNKKPPEGLKNYMKQLNKDLNDYVKQVQNQPTQGIEPESLGPKVASYKIEQSSKNLDPNKNIIGKGASIEFDGEVSLKQSLQGSDEELKKLFQEKFKMSPELSKALIEEILHAVAIHDSCLKGNQANDIIKIYKKSDGKVNLSLERHVEESAANYLDLYTEINLNQKGKKIDPVFLTTKGEGEINKNASKILESFGNTIDLDQENKKILSRDLGNQIAHFWKAESPTDHELKTFVIDRLNKIKESFVDKPLLKPDFVELLSDKSGEKIADHFLSELRGNKAPKQNFIFRFIKKIFSSKPKKDPELKGFSKEVKKNLRNITHELKKNKQVVLKTFGPQDLNSKNKPGIGK